MENILDGKLRVLDFHGYIPMYVYARKYAFVNSFAELIVNNIRECNVQPVSQSVIRDYLYNCTIHEYI